MKRHVTYIILMAGIVSISFAAIFIRLADAPAPAVAALRLIFSSLILAPFALISPGTRRSILSLNGKEILLILFSGLFLSLHFLAWITSLSYTAVSSSIVLVTTSPLFIALYTAISRKEKIGASVWAGLGFTIIGGLILGTKDFAAGGGTWVGDILAVGGAIAVAGYFLIGRSLRKKLSLLAYVFPVYSIAALFLTIWVPIFGVRLTDLSAQTYLYCLMMAVICQVIGHTIFNWALKRIKAAVVAMATLGEPVGTTFLAWFILHEIPGKEGFIGGAVILVGIFTVLKYNPVSDFGD
jgi:drug/metabolite transporter (DMT)-like permease